MGHLILTTSPWSILSWITLMLINDQWSLNLLDKIIISLLRLIRILDFNPFSSSYDQFLILINIDHAQIPTLWPINLFCHQRFQKALGQFCCFFIGHFDRKKLVDDLLKRSTIFPNDSRQMKQMLCFHVFDKFWQVVTLSRICECFPRQRKLLEMTQNGTFFSSLLLKFRFKLQIQLWTFRLTRHFDLWFWTKPFFFISADKFIVQYNDYEI